MSGENHDSLNIRSGVCRSPEFLQVGEKETEEAADKSEVDVNESEPECIEVRCEPSFVDGLEYEEHNEQIEGDDANGNLDPGKSKRRFFLHERNKSTNSHLKKIALVPSKFYLEEETSSHLKPTETPDFLAAPGNENDIIYYDCPGCREKFVTEKGLTRHRMKRHKIETRPVCEICGNEFSDITSLSRHTQTTHYGVRYYCDICPKTFGRKIILKNHIQTNHMGVRVNCEMCGKEFRNNRAVHHHMKTTHKEYRLSCELCKKYFFRSDRLSEHLQLIHRGVGYVCKICGKDFGKKSNLKSHTEAVHLGIKVHCELCGKNYSRKDKLLRHISTVHLKIRPKCELCGKDFPRRDKLLEHVNAMHPI